MVKKLMVKIKNKLNKNKESFNLDDEYMFSSEEIESLKEQNKKKLENLKLNKKKQKHVSFTSISNKLNGILDDKLSNEEEIPIKENISNNDEQVEEEPIIKEEVKDISEPKIEKIEIKDNVEEKEEVLEKIKAPKIEQKEEKKQESYINLSEKNQSIIMKNWNSIDLQQIDKDIIEGKDLLNHNYTITYGDKAAKFVHDIRKRYEVVICYLIGFNNEKKGIPNKTIFANKVDDEWKYLSNYIKLLEKIRSNRK